ncbi:MAG: hypothetical protein EOO85_29820, partial [Pedobacter sp.]
MIIIVGASRGVGQYLLQHYIQNQQNVIGTYLMTKPDLNASADEFRTREGGERAPRNGNGVNPDYTRLFINLGSVDNFTRGDLLGYICNTSKINGRGVGKIDVKGVYSFFEVPNAEAQQVIDAFKNADFQGREVRIELSGA